MHVAPLPIGLVLNSGEACRLHRQGLPAISQHAAAAPAVDGVDVVTGDNVHLRQRDHRRRVGEFQCHGGAACQAGNRAPQGFRHAWSDAKQQVDACGAVIRGMNWFWRIKWHGLRIAKQPGMLMQADVQHAGQLIEVDKQALGTWECQR